MSLPYFSELTLKTDIPLKLLAAAAHSFFIGRIHRILLFVVPPGLFLKLWCELENSYKLLPACSACNLGYGLINAW